MKKSFWLFKKINLHLRAEVIINISFLMLAAILLIGFTIAHINERTIVQERAAYGKRMIQDLQSMIDFISRDKREFSLNHPSFKQDIQNFARLYLRSKDLHELLIVDRQFDTITSKKSELINKRSDD